MAVLNLRGEVLKIRSSKGFSLSKIIRFISDECAPLLIASDVSPAPGLLEKVSASFPVRLYIPQESLSRRSKTRLVRAFSHRERERHKTDALAAALNAYEHLLPLLKKIEKKLYGKGPPDRIRIGDVARKILSGECGNIDRAIDALADEKDGKKAKVRGKRRSVSPKGVLPAE